MISSIVQYGEKYYYKGIEYSKDDLNLLLNKISKNRRIILCPQSILIKKYTYSGKSIDKFINNKICEDFTNKENILFHYEIDKESNNIYLYSIRDNIKRLYENANELSIELLQFKIKSSVQKKLKKINNSIILYKINDINYLLKISNDIIVDIITTSDINELKNYLIEEKNKKNILVKDKEYKEIDYVDFDYSIDLGVDTYEKICKE